MSSEIDDLQKNLTVVIAVVGGVIAGLAVIIILIVSILCAKISRYEFEAASLKKQVDLMHMSLRSIEKDMSKTQVALDRFPKNIVQFPMTKSPAVDDDDRSGTEPASPIFFRKGYMPTPLASSLTSVTEIPSEYQITHHPLQRNNAIMIPGRTKQVGPPVPPKRAHSFNNNSFNY